MTVVRYNELCRHPNHRFLSDVDDIGPELHRSDSRAGTSSTRFTGLGYGSRSEIAWTSTLTFRSMMNRLPSAGDNVPGRKVDRTHMPVAIDNKYPLLAILTLKHLVRRVRVLRGYQLQSPSLWRR